MVEKVAVLVEDMYEDLELWYPKLRLEEAGYALKCAAPEIKTYIPDEAKAKPEARISIFTRKKISPKGRNITCTSQSVAA